MSIDVKWHALAETIKNVQEASKKLPSDYDLGQLLKTFDALIEKYAMFRVGDRGKIVDPPMCTGGWIGSEHRLCDGALGTITEREFYLEQNCFVYGFEPDDSDLYKPSFALRLPDGTLLEDAVYLRSQRATYMLPEKRLAKAYTERVERSWCDEISPINTPCERPKGHAGPHVAGCMVWGEGVEPKKCPTCGK